jgi:CBS domain-containing protein
VQWANDLETGASPDEDGAAFGADAEIRVFASDPVATVPGGATLLEVARELVADDVGLLVVGTTDKVEGVVSERDVVRAVAAGRATDTPIRELATTKVVQCDATATVAEVAEVMMEQYIRHVLVEEDGRLVGIVSARDLLGAYATAAI